MPYIVQNKRQLLDPFIEELALKLKEMGFDKGDLNYTITRLICARLEHTGKSYSTLSDITGVLNDVKTEFERRVVAPYERGKISINGDVYDQ